MNSYEKRAAIWGIALTGIIVATKPLREKDEQPREVLNRTNCEISTYFQTVAAQKPDWADNKHFKTFLTEQDRRCVPAWVKKDKAIKQVAETPKEGALCVILDLPEFCEPLKILHSLVPE